MIEDACFDKNNISDLRKICPGPFETCLFKGIKFSDIALKSSAFLDCKFNQCHLAGQSLLGAVFRDVDFEDCNLMGINWAALKRFENCSFKGCKLDLCSFQDLKLKGLKLIECSLKEVDFSGADLGKADFSDSFLSGASFSRANLSQADFRRAKAYFIDPTFTKIKGARFSFPEAISLIVALGAVVEL